MMKVTGLEAKNQRSFFDNKIRFFKYSTNTKG
jgi:hypothetical protein